MYSAFQLMTDKLVSSEILAHYDPNLFLKLSRYVSSFGLGSVLAILILMVMKSHLHSFKG